MISDLDALRARADRYRQKATELRERSRRLWQSTLSHDFLGLAVDYDAMAAQLESAAKDLR
jgi:hypothetical protein